MSSNTKLQKVTPYPKIIYEQAALNSKFEILAVLLNLDKTIVEYQATWVTNKYFFIFQYLYVTLTVNFQNYACPYLLTSPSQYNTWFCSLIRNFQRITNIFFIQLTLYYVKILLLRSTHFTLLGNIVASSLWIQEFFKSKITPPFGPNLGCFINETRFIPIRLTYYKLHW